MMNINKMVKIFVIVEILLFGEWEVIISPNNCVVKSDDLADQQYQIDLKAKIEKKKIKIKKWWIC